MISVKDYNAIGNGFTDDTKAFQQALDSGSDTILIPHGAYIISETLLVHSNTTILAEPTARIVMDGETPKLQGRFLLTNADWEKGNTNIAIIGGVWDGNNQGEANFKGDIFDTTRFSGAVLNFFNVDGLKLDGLTVANSVTYTIRMAKLSNFTIENISFFSDKLAYNQDGLHFNGEVRNGKVKNIRALSKGQTNDDLIALNADDSMERVENIGMTRGDIENLVIENVYAEDCHTIVRMFSVDSAIRNITLRNIQGGFRFYAINADAGRYCRTPVFDDSEWPNGVGRIENVLVENMTCYCTNKEQQQPAIILESLADGLELRNLI